MDANTVMSIASKETVFAILFIILGAAVIRWVKAFIDQQREHSQEREQYIMEMHKKQLEELKEQAMHQRNDNRELLVEQRQSFDRREKDLLEHLKQNTHQLENISDTLKDVKTNIVSLEDNLQIIWNELDRKVDKDKIN
ncbi:phosphodiesterase [Bacillus phage Blastoid]|uniref:Phosphodiesterase n=1 Tax=Bacillus phage Blastoid TaxID=2880540 RepID=U5PW55_9CAUD|nr:involved in bacteriocin production or immunity [Bacillus phage Blastoid]AGY46832.1 phosphodiesterase [Bacillus phage Blastoid]